MNHLFKDIRLLVDAFEGRMNQVYLKLPKLLSVLATVLLSPIIIGYLVVTRLIRLIYLFLRSIFLFVFRPFRVIKHHFLAFFIWIAFTLFGGLMGVIVNIMRNVWFIDNNRMSFKTALSLEMINGSFYTYAIAIVAAVLCSVFIVFSESKKEDLNFRSHQIVLVSLSIFVVLFGGVFYALSKGGPEVIIVDDLCYVDWQQLIVFISAIVISVYSFCVIRLNDHKEEFKELIDTNSKEEDLLANKALSGVKNFLQQEENQ